jgi:hypothetical protein
VAAPNLLMASKVLASAALRVTGSPSVLRLKPRAKRTRMSEMANSANLSQTLGGVAMGRRRSLKAARQP